MNSNLPSLNRLSASVRIWTPSDVLSRGWEVGKVLIAFRFQSEFGPSVTMKLSALNVLVLIAFRLQSEFGPTITITTSSRVNRVLIAFRLQSEFGPMMILRKNVAVFFQS